MASVYKRGRTYWIRFTWHGQEIRRSARTSSKQVAQHYLAKVLEEHQRLDRGERARHFYAEAVERFEAEWMASIKQSTQRRYASSLRHLRPIFGKLRLDEVTKGRLADFVSQRRRDGASSATIRRDLAVLSAVFSFAVAVDMTDIHPVKAFSKRHLREAPPRTTYPSDEEIENLIAHAPIHIARVIRFLAETGVRMEEALSLEWPNVSLERREIRLIKTKTSSPRTVPLSDAAIRTLKSVPRHPTSKFVFWHSDGERYQQFSGHFRRIAKRAGFRHRCHDLRHRFASVFLQATGDLAALQAILGHKSIEMTLRYGHLVTGHLHSAVAKAGTRIGTGPIEKTAHVADREQPDVISANFEVPSFMWTVAAMATSFCTSTASADNQTEPLETTSPS